MMGYKKTIEWIALNDEPTLNYKDMPQIESQISVQLVADQFDKSTYKVSCDVLKIRSKLRSDFNRKVDLEPV